MGLPRPLLGDLPYSEAAFFEPLYTPTQSKSG
jgi:hypothetical protein